MYSTERKYFRKLATMFNVKITIGNDHPKSNLVVNSDDKSETIDVLEVFVALTDRISHLEKQLEDNIVISDTEHAMLLLRHKGD